MSRTALVNERLGEPFGVMRRLSEEMDRMFEGFTIPRAFSGWKEAVWAPRIESFAKNGSFVVRAELPGLTDKDVHVELVGNTLTIKGERKQEKEDTQAEYYACERSYGAFIRALDLPDGVKADAVKAVFKDGILEVSMPMPTAKTEEARRVPIAAS